MLEKMITFGPDDGHRLEEGHDHDQRTVFWGEIAPAEHMVQIYKDDQVFMDALEGFVGGGIKAGDGVIVIATPAHLAMLEHRLLTRGIDVGGAADSDQYIALDAEEALSKFMIKGWVDSDLFMKFVSGVVERASDARDGQPARRVRAFGEMVAVLWAQGNRGATMRLEYLWHDFCQKNAFCLFCAYPRACFTQDAETSIRQICAAHNRIVAG